MNAQEAARSFVCKELGCEADSTAERGINAYCEKHRHERLNRLRRERSSEALAGIDAANGRPPILKPPNRPGKRPKRPATPLEQAAWQLADIAARMEDARGRAEEALAEYRDLKAAWRAALANITRVEQQREPMRSGDAA